MTVLLVDIGNTRVKWARLRGASMGKQYAAANAGWRVEDYARRVIGRSSERILVSSVAGVQVNKTFVAAAKKAGAPKPEFAVSQRRAGGITTAYLEPWRLGVDRFIGAIGARHLAEGKPVCVVNVGTAITIDLVDASGRHRGGAIVPGPALMVDSLLEHTSGIRRRAQGGVNGVRSLFARTTRTAIGQGSQYAAAAVIDRAVEEARNDLGCRPMVLLTGGGSTAVKPLLRTMCTGVPDLILRGLAVWGGELPSRGV